MKLPVMIGLTPAECSILYAIIVKYRILVDYRQLPKLKVSNGEMAQIESKLLSGGLFYDEFGGELG